MESENKLSNRGQFVKLMLMVGVVILACLAYFVAVFYYHGGVYSSPWLLLSSRDMLLSFLLITLIWSSIETSMKLNEVYRSRPYSYILILHALETGVGILVFLFCMVIFGIPNYGRDVLLLFGALCTAFTFGAKVIFYHCLRNFRKKGRNTRSVIFVTDRGGERLLAQIARHFEWGYRIKAVICDDYMMQKLEGRYDRLYPINSVNFDEVLTQDIDDVIYAREELNSNDITQVMDICNDYGITFRLYSNFMNRVSTSAYLRYFDTNAVLTITSTPVNYAALLAKRVIDVLFSLGVILVGLPFFLLVALAIKLDSKGPVFFKQKRSGLKGQVFEVYKFRTMVTNAEALKKDLMSQNEADGPAFKMTNDPRITRVGRIIRKSGIDEFPQFLNVLFGDMSIVGPRPPLPDEVAQYERWQMRRLAMKPGITCLWQVAPNRNSITFDEWMKMDMEYIDNWSLTLDIVLIFKTASTIFRADGK